MKQYITQEQVVDLIASMPVLKATPSASEIATLTCNAAIQHYIDQQVKELPGLPKEFEVFAEDVPHSIIHGVTLEDCKAYGAACAAHAREVALSEAIDAAIDACGFNGVSAQSESHIRQNIEALKGK